MFAAVTTTPFGTPVVPDVKMMYAGWSGATGVGGRGEPRCSSWGQSDGPKTLAGRASPSSSTRVAPLASTMSASIFARWITYARRDAGVLGFSGTYVAPAHAAPTMPAKVSIDRAARMPTRGAAFVVT